MKSKAILGLLAAIPRLSYGISFRYCFIDTAALADNFFLARLLNYVPPQTDHPKTKYSMSFNRPVYTNRQHADKA